VSAPGPLSVWLAQSSGKPPRLIDRIGDRVCAFNDSHPRTREFQALLAAAPELLEALKLAHDALGESRGYHQSTTATRIRAAIAKAEGRP
jgi:hypothetical protein